MTTVLIVEDEAGARESLTDILDDEGYDVTPVETLAAAHDVLDRDAADIILLDVFLGKDNGLQLLARVASEQRDIPVIVFTGSGDIEMAVDAMHTGAHDFITKPINTERLLRSLKRADERVRMYTELNRLREVSRQQQARWVRGDSPAMHRVYNLIGRVADKTTSVLLTGATGTGKEVIANIIHEASPRAGKPLIAVHMGAISPTLIDSELFGHEANAFTDAKQLKKGLFEVADGSTLFLDEVSTMSLETQTRLLRVLQERKFRRVGGTKDISVDIRVIAATNRDLKALVESGEFREDLYYRLNVYEVALPALRDRIDDLPAFLGAFIRQLGPETGSIVHDTSPLAHQAMMAYDWPGNIRELRNVVERALLLADGELIELSHLPPEIARLAEATEVS